MGSRRRPSLPLQGVESTELESDIGNCTDMSRDSRAGRRLPGKCSSPKPTTDTNVCTRCDQNSRLVTIDTAGALPSAADSPAGRGHR
jgi:hypothetical protein